MVDTSLIRAVVTCVFGFTFFVFGFQVCSFKSN